MFATTSVPRHKSFALPATNFAYLRLSHLQQHHFAIKWQSQLHSFVCTNFDIHITAAVHKQICILDIGLVLHLNSRKK